MRAAVAANPATAAPVATAGLAATAPAVAPPILNNMAPMARTPATLPAVAALAAPPPAPAAPVPRPAGARLTVPVPIEASASLTLAIVPALSAAGKANGRPTMMRRASRCASIASRQLAHSSMCARRAARPWLPPSPAASAARDRSMRRHWMLAAWAGGATAAAAAPAPSATFWYSSRKRARARKSNTCTLLDVEPSACAISAELRPPISRITRASRYDGVRRCRVARTAY